MDQKIEKNKEGKNRNEMIKMKQLLETFQNKKEKDKKNNELIALRKWF